MVFLVGLLDLVGAYETLQDFLTPVAPGAVIETIETLQQDTSTSTSVVAFVVGAGVGRLGGERRDERRHQVGQPRVRPGRDAAVLEDADRRDRPRLPDGPRARRPAPAHRLRRAARHRDRGQGRPRRRLRALLDDPALAARLRRDPALLRARLLPRAERRPPQLDLADARVAGRRGRLARRCRGSSRSTRASPTPTRRPTARSRAASCCSSGSTTRPSPCSSARS